MRDDTPVPDAIENDAPLAGKTALITGVSRRRGIGFAVAGALADLGAHVVIHHHRAHDLDQPWGADDLDAVRTGIRSRLRGQARFLDIAGELSDPDATPALIDAATAVTGSLDVLICNHARSGGDGGILDMTADRLDAFWDVNTRATLLLTAEFARRKTPGGAVPRQPGERGAGSGPFTQARGHVIWMTSGQGLGPMRGEVAYATSKAALAGVTRTVAAELLEIGIVLNTVNPGPVNTGYLDPETADRPLEEIEAYLATTPFGRLGRPSDPAALISWLVSPAGSWVVGQVLTSDGGFSLG